MSRPLHNNDKEKHASARVLDAAQCLKAAESVSLQHTTTSLLSSLDADQCLKAAESVSLQHNTTASLLSSLDADQCLKAAESVSLQHTTAASLISSPGAVQCLKAAESVSLQQATSLLSALDAAHCCLKPAESISFQHNNMTSLISSLHVQDWLDKHFIEEDIGGWFTKQHLESAIRYSFDEDDDDDMDSYCDDDDDDDDMTLDSLVVTKSRRSKETTADKSR